MLSRRFDAPTTSIDGLRSDLESALKLAQSLCVPTTLGALAHGFVLNAVRRGRGGLDVAALVTVYEDLAGFRLSDTTPSAALVSGGDSAKGGCPSASPRRGLRAPAPSSAMTTVGFIGLGRIGKPIAESVRRAGFAMVVHNRSQEAVDDLVRLGAERATSPAEVARRSDVVLTCLPDNPAAERVYCAPDGLIAAVRPGQTLVDLGTTALVLTRQLHEAITACGAHFLDAPVSGGLARAAQGRLTIMIGATEDGFGRASPVLAAAGEQLFHMGPVGAGQAAKQANNMLMAINFAAICEGFSLGVAAGVPAEHLLKALVHSDAGSYAMEMRAERIVGRDFRTAFPVLGQLKDAQAALDLGRYVHTPLPLMALVHELTQSAAAQGWAAEDWAAVTKVYEGLASVAPPAPRVRGAAPARGG